VYDGNDTGFFRPCGASEIFVGHVPAAHAAGYTLPPLPGL
jgi:hypothetical protein